jgi:hypothetical protein
VNHLPGRINEDDTQNHGPGFIGQPGFDGVGELIGTGRKERTASLPDIRISRQTGRLYFRKAAAGSENQRNHQQPDEGAPSPLVSMFCLAEIFIHGRS